jgi:hypothetical protein
VSRCIARHTPSRSPSPFGTAGSRLTSAVSPTVWASLSRRTRFGPTPESIGTRPHLRRVAAGTIATRRNDHPGKTINGSIDGRRLVRRNDGDSQVQNLRPARVATTHVALRAGGSIRHESWGRGSRVPACSTRDTPNHRIFRKLPPRDLAHHVLVDLRALPMHALACTAPTSDLDCRVRRFCVLYLPLRPPAASDFLCLAQRAFAARLRALLRSSGLTFRHRAAPSPTAVLFMGSSDSFRLAMSRISSARSSNTSGGRPLWRMMRRSRIVRRTPSSRENVGVRSVFGSELIFDVDMRMLVR